MKWTIAAALFALATPAIADEVFIGAGDIAMCGRDSDEKTAAILDANPGTVFTLGDTVYQRGTAAEFVNCYQPSWGRHKSRTRPVIGNHEYMTSGATPYLETFNTSKNYSFDLGDWHIVSLDSNCQLAENGASCSATSPTMQWLKADLAANPNPCTLVMFHHPRWSSNIKHGNTTRMAAAWKIMYQAGVDVVLSAHAHSYERFAPLRPDGTVDRERGIRSFVVGTGGGDLTGFGTPVKGSVVRNSIAHGVLKLVLKPAGYSWEFIPVAGQTFTDKGGDTCH